MHELTLALNIVQILEEQSALLKFNRVKQVWLEIGALSCIEETSLRFGLDAAIRDTLADGAQFHIEIKPARCWCHECSKPFTTTHHTASCPVCHSFQIQHENGTEMRVRELDVE